MKPLLHQVKVGSLELSFNLCLEKPAILIRLNQGKNVSLNSLASLSKVKVLRAAPYCLLDLYLSELLKLLHSEFRQ